MRWIRKTQRKAQRMVQRQGEAVAHEMQEAAHTVATIAATSDAFTPHRLVRGARIQTLASSYGTRRLGAMLPGEQLVIVDAGEDETGCDAGVRLLGYYNVGTSGEASKGLVITLHGWEGCSHSTFNLVMARALLAAGYDVFRLNLRDHGPRSYVNPHALNRGLFMGTLLGESHRAVQQAAAWAQGRPVFLIGPSMGGNFALRMAARHNHEPIANLQRVVAISPAINPRRTTDRIDEQYPFRRYFRDRWLRSVMTKAHLFPELYQFEPLLGMARLRPMTEWLVEHYTDMASVDEYFAKYAVTKTTVTELNVPTTVLTAADDPVIAVEDFAQFQETPMLDLKIERFGGHVGFVNVWPLRHMLPEMVLAEIECV